MENKILAGIGNRFLAQLIDGFLIIITTIILMFVLFNSQLSELKNSGPDAGRSFAIILISYYPILFLIQIIYFTYFESSNKQATIGKMAMKIKVVNQEGERLSVGNALGRSLGKILSSLTCGIGFFVAFFNKDEKSLHDMIASTFVVRAAVQEF